MKKHDLKTAVQAKMEELGLINQLHAQFLLDVCEEAQESDLDCLKMTKIRPQSHAHSLAADLVMAYLAGFEFDLTMKCIDIEKNVEEDFNLNSKTSAFQDLDVSTDIPIQDLIRFRYEEQPEQRDMQHDFIREQFQQFYDDLPPDEETNKRKTPQKFIPQANVRQINPQYITQSSATDTSQETTESVSPDVKRNVPRNVSHNVSPNVSHNVSPNVPRNVSPNVPHNVSPDVSHNVSPDVSYSPTPTSASNSRKSSTPINTGIVRGYNDDEEEDEEIIEPVVVPLRKKAKNNVFQPKPRPILIQRVTKESNGDESPRLFKPAASPLNVSVPKEQTNFDSDESLDLTFDGGAVNIPDTKTLQLPKPNQIGGFQFKPITTPPTTTTTTTTTQDGSSLDDSIGDD